MNWRGVSDLDVALKVKSKVIVDLMQWHCTKKTQRMRYSVWVNQKLCGLGARALHDTVHAARGKL
jgi:hypothetical protein